MINIKLQTATLLLHTKHHQSITLQTTKSSARLLPFRPTSGFSPSASPLLTVAAPFSAPSEGTSALTVVAPPHSSEQAPSTFTPATAVTASSAISVAFLFLSTSSSVASTTSSLTSTFISTGAAS